MLALKRLAADNALRRTLSAASHAWWRSHATLAHALEKWEQLLEDAASARAAPRRGADHTLRVYDILEPFGVRVDVLES